VKFRYYSYAAAKSRAGSRKSCLQKLCSSLLLVGGLFALMMLMPAFTQNQNLLSYDCRLSARFPDKVLRWCRPIMAHSRAAELSPDLVAALIWHESGGNPAVYSRSGAVGLMQIMPRDGLAADFKCKNGPCFANRPTSSELESPDVNIRFGTRLLRDLLNHHKGDMREALRAYGPHDVGYSYADTILAVYRQYGSH
jgi:soluble lytic murein transglycosylase-like protein